MKHKRFPLKYCVTNLSYLLSCRIGSEATGYRICLRRRVKNMQKYSQCMRTVWPKFPQFGHMFYILYTASLLSVFLKINVRVNKRRRTVLRPSKIKLSLHGLSLRVCLCYSAFKTLSCDRFFHDKTLAMYSEMSSETLFAYCL